MFNQSNSFLGYLSLIRWFWLDIESKAAIFWCWYLLSTIFVVSYEKIMLAARLQHSKQATLKFFVLVKQH
ncbi:hypothetical protein VCR15J2_660012 [Vibrio coralliirubri]|nr:hypothetical protein VCR15J2_660012 [Vibrio coralliirubri]